MVSKRFTAQSLEPVNMHVTRQREITVVGGTKAFSQLQLSWVLKSGRGRTREMAAPEGFGQALMMLKMGEGATSQGTRVVARSWKRQRNTGSSRASRKEHSPEDMVTLAH